LGLTIGITCFAIIMLYVENETSYDKFHKNESFRFLSTEQVGNGESRTYGIIGVETHNTFAEKVAGIEDVILVRDHGAGPLLLEYKDIKFKTRNFFFSEPDFFDYFDFQLLQGDKRTALIEPNNVVITESTAKRVFGNANPMGEFIQFSGGMNFTLKVAGVVEDVKNSHIQFDFLLSFDLKDESGYTIMRDGFANSFYGYYKLEAATQPEEVAKRMKDYFIDFYSDSKETLVLLEKEEYKLQSVYDAYFESYDVTFDEGFRKGNKQSILILSSIGFFIMLIGCMNYINAATAKALNRSKEIGVRKVFGAYRRQLFAQFIYEAFLITFAAILFSMLAIDIALPYFENLMSTKLRFGLFENPYYLIGLVSTLLLVTFLSGVYPALIMSGFKTSDSLKKQNKGMLKGNGFRSFLVGIQVFLAVILLSSIFIILKQSRFITQKDLGFNKNDILIVPNNSEKVSGQSSTYKNELLKSPYIYDATTSMDVLGFGTTNNSGYVYLEGQPKSNANLASYFTVSMEFIDIQGFIISEGRSFDSDLASDSTAIIVNQAFVKTNGLENPVGKKVKLYSEKGESKTIIGVLEDFHFQSLHNKVAPAVFVVNKQANWFWTIKLDPNHKQEAIAHIEKTWEAIESDFPIGYWFLESNFDNFYSEEAKLQKAIEVFAVICMFLCCLGIYGMTAFTIERKSKEIGIRKVLGAAVPQLVWLVNQRFVKLFVLALICAIPLVIYFMEMWLNSFAYRIDIGLGSFALSGIIVLVIIIITVSIQAIKTALSNPIHSLRSE
jgi:putative ABC transport system permease protein